MAMILIRLRISQPALSKGRRFAVAMALAMVAIAGTVCRPAMCLTCETASPNPSDSVESDSHLVEPIDADAPGFEFPKDRGGKILETLLPPRASGIARPEFRSSPLNRRGIASIERPEIPQSSPPLELPRLPVASRKPPRPSALPESFALESYSADLSLPHRVELPATALLSQRAPDAVTPPALPVQARHTLNRASLEDATTDFSAQSVRAEAMPLRTVAAEFWRFAIPEPQVFRGPPPDSSVEFVAPIVRPLR
jgi:hypothetical protein